MLIFITFYIIHILGMLSSLILYYKATDGKAVVALRSRRMGLCASSKEISPYTKNQRGMWPETKPARWEMLILPTGITFL